MRVVFPIICIAAAAASTVYLLMQNYYAGLVQAGVLVCLLLAGILLFAFRTTRLKRAVRAASRYFSEDSMTERPFPAVICSDKGSILWFNKLFENEVL